MKTKSSGAGAGAMFMKKRAPEPELCHVYDGSTALKKVFHDEKKTTTFIQS